MSEEHLTIARASANLGEAAYQVRIRAGHHDLLSDEPPRFGGADVGPAPYELLLSALAACTSITLRMYAERKQWDLKGLSLELVFSRNGEEARIDRRIAVTGDLTDEQRARLADIAERTPVTLTLKGGVAIETTLRPA